MMCNETRIRYEPSYLGYDCWKIWGIEEVLDRQQPSERGKWVEINHWPQEVVQLVGEVAAWEHCKKLAAH